MEDEDGDGTQMTTQRCFSLERGTEHVGGGRNGPGPEPRRMRQAECDMRVRRVCSTLDLGAREGRYSAP